MEQWQDQSIILAVRAHGESGAIVSVLTKAGLRQAGYMRGAFSSKNRGTLEIGNIVDANWRARNENSLGSLTLELSRSTAARIMQNPLKLAALQSACALCDQSLPEGEGYSSLYNGVRALLEILESEVWEAGYIMWELALLKELGFALDLTRCAGGGDDTQLAYVSPKSGCAVSLDAGEPYKDKLLPLAGFLKPQGGEAKIKDIISGLKMTGFFLEHWAFAHHNRGLPETRQRLGLRFVAEFAKTGGLISGSDSALGRNMTKDTNELGKEIHGTRS